MSDVSNWVIETTDTQGTGQITLGGTDVGYTTFRGAGLNGNVWYSILDSNGNREAGIGSFNGVTTLTRNNVMATLVNGAYNDSAPSPIDLTGNDAQVACTFNATAYLDLLNHLGDTENPHGVTASQVSYDAISDNVTDAGNLQNAMEDQSSAIEKNISSMSGSYTGGRLTGFGTTFNISAGSGTIYDCYTNPENTATIDVTWDDINNIAIQTGGLSIGNVRIFLTYNGSVIQVPGSYSQSLFRTNIFLGSIVFESGQIIDINEAPAIVKQTATDVYDDMNINIRISGTQIRPVENQLRIWTDEGLLFFPGINWHNDKTDPNSFTLDPIGGINTPAIFTPMTQTGLLGAETSVIPQQYNPTDSGDTLTALGNNRATIHRLYTVGTGIERKLVLLYGQKEYNSAVFARQNLINEDDYITFPDETADLFFLGHICVEEGATSFIDPDNAWISSWSYSSSTGGGGGGVVDHTSLVNRDIEDQHPIEAIGTFGGEQLRDTLDAKVVWKNTWSQQAYQTNDMVRDGEFTMIANKITEDRAAPQTLGTPDYVFDGTMGASIQSASIVMFGQRYSFSNFKYISSVRIYTHADYQYRLFLIHDAEGSPTAEYLSEIIATTTGWTEFPISGRYMSPAAFDFLVEMTKIIDTPVTADAVWDYDTPNNAGGAPDAGEAVQANSSPEILTFAAEAQGSTDMGVVLAALEAGSKISAGSINWTVMSNDQEGNSGATTFNIEVSPAVQLSSDGQTQFTFETVAPDNLDYASDSDYWLGNSEVGGIFIVDAAYDNPTPNDNAYGVDIRIQDVSISDDWDFVAISGGAGSGSSIHGSLSGRDDVDQHPIAAVTDLQTTLDTKATVFYEAAQPIIEKAGDIYVEDTAQTLEWIDILSAGNHSFDPGASGLTSTTVQDAIIELKTLIDGLP